MLITEPSTLFELLPIGAYRSSADGKQLRANPALVRLNGYAFEDEMLNHVRDIAHEWYVDPQQRGRFMELMMRDGRVVDFRSEIYRHKTRERIWIREHAHVVRDNEGQILYFEGTIEDITESQNARLALIASERRFRALTERAQVMTLVCDTEGTIAFVSHAALQMLGAPAQDLLRRNIYDWMHPDDTQQARREMRQVVQHSNTGQESIYRYRHTDGTWRHLASLATNCLADAAVQGIVLNFRDVTDYMTAERSRQRLYRLLEATQTMTSVGGWEADMMARQVFWTDETYRILEANAQEYTPTLDNVQQFFPPSSLQRLSDAVENDDRQGNPMTMELELVTAHGRQIWVSVVRIDTYEQGRLTRCTSALQDITERKLAQSALRESEARWKLALESTGDGMWDWDIPSGVERISPRGWEMYGFVADTIADSAFGLNLMTHPDDRPAMLRDRQAHLDGRTPTYVSEHRIQCKDGSWKWILSRGMVISRDTDSQPLRMIGTHTDITNRKNAEALVWQQANFDALTGLPNRRMLRDRLEREIKKVDRDGKQLAILFVDLDHFKEVNDTLGHDAGDQLLVEAARRISGCVRESDTVARMGGDEFTLVLSELDETGQLDRVLREVLAAMAALFQLGNEQVYISASIGITLYPSDGSGVETLFKNADQALYEAKGAGRNRFSFFTSALQDAAQNRVRLANDLRSGLQDEQFHLVYQPIVSLRDGSIHKAEALLRWQHPSRGLVSPADFIPVAESTGLIVEIGEWVFRNSAWQCLLWRARFHADFQISINKSPVQFHNDAGRQNSWVLHLEDIGLGGNGVVVEITEGLLLDTSNSVTAQLLQLRDAGIQVSLDDFGTGYSSLIYLQKFDIDYLKIDQSFVRDLVDGGTELALCKAIIVMAHELGMQVVAEGVETEEQRCLLANAGCDFGQGYLFTRPLRADDFERFLANHNDFATSV